MGVFAKLNQLVNKDTSRENESKKATVLIRIMTLILSVYCLIVAMIFAAMGALQCGAAFLLTTLSYLLVFIISYSASQRIVLSCFLIVTGICYFTTPWLFGWDSSVQVFPVLLIIVYFFSSYQKLMRKLIFMTVIFAAYLFLSLRFGDTSGVLPMEEGMHSILRDGNMLAVLVCVGLAAYLFSNEKQEMENKLIEYNKKLEEKASVDPLTGLYNRRKCTEYLENLMKSSSDRMFCICMGDIDHFKRVNDTYGHDIGDLVLKGVAKVLTSCTKDVGLVSRWGGEEFLIVLPDINGDEAMVILFNIQSEMRKMCVMADDQKIKVTLTYGLTEYDPSLTLDQNIKEADDKLYLGKEQGRDTVIF